MQPVRPHNDPAEGQRCEGGVGRNPMDVKRINLDYDEPGLLEKLALSIAVLSKHKLDIIAALEYGGGKHDFDAVVSQVVRGDAHLYPLPNSVIIAEIIRGSRDIYHIFVAAGDLNEILSVNEFMKEQARANYCDVLGMSGRLGWKRPLRDLGWAEKSLYMETPI